MQRCAFCILCFVSCARPPPPPHVLNSSIQCTPLIHQLLSWLASEAPQWWSGAPAAAPVVLDPHGLVALFSSHHHHHHQHHPPVAWAIDPSVGLEGGGGEEEDDDDDGVGPWLKALDRERQRLHHASSSGSGGRKSRDGSDGGAAVAVTVGLHPSLQGRARARAWALLMCQCQQGLGGWRVGDPFQQPSAERRRRRALLVSAVAAREGGGEGEGGGEEVEWVAPAFLEACYLLQGGRALALGDVRGWVGACFIALSLSLCLGVRMYYFTLSCSSVTPRTATSAPSSSPRRLGGPPPSTATPVAPAASSQRQVGERMRRTPITPTRTLKYTYIHTRARHRVLHCRRRRFPLPLVVVVIPSRAGLAARPLGRRPHGAAAAGARGCLHCMSVDRSSPLTHPLACLNLQYT